MKSVVLLIADWCLVCPGAKELWDSLKKEYDFNYEACDIASEKGQELVKEYGVIGVPVSIIDGKVAFTGVPNRDDAVTALCDS